MRVVSFLSLFLVSLASAAPTPAAVKTGGFNGSVEMGFAVSGGPTGTQWLVDQFEWNQRFDASERIHFFFNNAVSLTSPSTLPGAFNNSVNYFSAYRISGTNYTIASSGAYLEARLSEPLRLTVGHLRVPFGLESQLARFDSQTYFYTGTFTTAQNAGWLWDLGAQLEITRTIPGQLRLAVLDGRKSAGTAGPAIVAQYEFTIETSAFSLIPSVSAYFGKFQGDPKDLGLTLGTQWLLGRLAMNVELLHTVQPAGAVSTSLYVEPSVDLGVAEVGLKAEYLNISTAEDLNVGVAITKSLPERLRLRLLYQAAGLMGSIRPHQHDVRVLIGTHW